MGCTLDKFTNYQVGRVVNDRNEGRITVQIINAPKSCPDGTYSSKTAEIIVAKNAPATLAFNVKEKHSIVFVPRSEYVEVVGGHTLWGLLGWMLGALVVAGVIKIVYNWVIRTNAEADRVLNERLEETSKRAAAASNCDKYADAREKASYPKSFVQPPANLAPQPVIINNQPSVSHTDGLLTGMILGNMMSGGHSTHTERIVEREIIHDTPRREESDPSYDDDSRRSSSYSSDDSSSSSYSSDSSSSYSSDSGSSDSGSSYSSDN